MQQHNPIAKLNQHPMNQTAKEMVERFAPQSPKFQDAEDLELLMQAVFPDGNLHLINLLRWAENLTWEDRGSRKLQTLELIQKQNPNRAMQILLGQTMPSQENREEIEVILQNLDPEEAMQETRMELIGTRTILGLIDFLELEMTPEYHQTAVG